MTVQTTSPPTKIQVEGVPIPPSTDSHQAQALEATLRSLRNKYGTVVLSRVWLSEPSVDTEPEARPKRYLRCRIRLNNVTTKWWYNSKLERWCRNT